MIARQTPPSLEKGTHPMIACHHCGGIDTPALGPGKGPHKNSWWCKHCERFLKWASPLPPKQRAARAEQHKRQAMAGRPVTAGQLKLLQSLKYQGGEPVDRLEAAE